HRLPQSSERGGVVGGCGRAGEIEGAQRVQEAAVPRLTLYPLPETSLRHIQPRLPPVRPGQQIARLIIPRGPRDTLLQGRDRGAVAGQPKGRCAERTWRLRVLNAERPRLTQRLHRRLIPPALQLHDPKLVVGQRLLRAERDLLPQLVGGRRQIAFLE